MISDKMSENKPDETARFLERLPSEGTIVIVGCMDRRLVRLFMLFGDTGMSTKEKQAKLSEMYKARDETYGTLSTLLSKLDPNRIKILSNAGSNVEGLAPDLERAGKIAGMLVVCHTQCGGMSVVATGLVDKVTEEDNEFFRHLGGSRYHDAYKGPKISDAAEREAAIVSARIEAEKMNPGIQAKSASRFSNNVLALTVKIENINIRLQGRDHWLVVANPAVGRYPSYFNGTPRDQTYGVIGSEEATAVDARIAKEVIGVAKVVNARASRLKAF